MRLLSIPWMGIMNVSLTPDTLRAAVIRTGLLTNLLTRAGEETNSPLFNRTLTFQPMESLLNHLFFKKLTNLSQSLFLNLGRQILGARASKRVTICLANWEKLLFTNLQLTTFCSFHSFSGNLSSSGV